MESQKEYEKRHQAIQLYKKGHGFNKILQVVQRSRGWLHKWLSRYKEYGNKGLKDRSRAPKRIWRRVCGRLIKKILSLREELETHKTRRSAFSGIRAEVIHREPEKRKIRNIP
ncbi:MAG: helix-turn-helix domain-containing protein [Candidatus Brocadia sp.]|nr:helix-turn-helix domain-containing protein [Candidatus Brocadia sp.]